MTVDRPERQARAVSGHNNRATGRRNPDGSRWRRAEDFAVAAQHIDASRTTGVGDEHATWSVEYQFRGRCARPRNPPPLRTRGRVQCDDGRDTVDRLGTGDQGVGPAGEQQSRQHPGEREAARLGPTIDGSIVGASARSSLDIADPSVRQYRGELDRFYPGKRYDTGAFGIWGATDLVLQAMRGIEGDVNANTTLSALRSFKGNTALFGPLDFTKPLADPQYRRMFITNSFNYRITNAKQVRIDDALDLAPLFNKSP